MNDSSFVEHLYQFVYKPKDDLIMLVFENAREHEAAAMHTARALVELVQQGVADEERAAALARAATRAPLAPPPAAVALGAPQLHLGVLYIAEPPKLVVFQQNNSITLRQFWRTLASAWNATTAVWSNAWFSCDKDGEGWWGGVAAARGSGPARSAAALFRRWPALPCEEAMNDWLGGAPLCDAATTDCEATPSFGSGDRRIEAVAVGMWTVLEVVLLGAFLMYASAASQFISVAKWRCIAGAWLRELGFVACYGSVVLRLWVLLAEFRTRKAHRWTPRDSEVLRVVGAMVMGAACYLAAFTATAACEEDASAGCARAAWHHVTAGAELLLLAAGLRIAYAARNANVPFQERGWLAAALCCEGLYRVVVRRRVSVRKVKRSPPSEEVRAELKRLYVQLEILRNKTLRRDNPHISKRRGGRKPPHRRFSLQALQARRGCKGKAGGSASVVEASEAGDASRTPEDSVCSAEGPSHYTDADTQA
ncbi:hypothetical protein HW555_011229 [Spodoptera exigua]|uniref:G-protein coupled receptors family 3 profile domain-containing protein n=1 Tax=Spodoptera exigua TaxID=7107 RepID=A0A835G859_SPOEX|nr:hypothetical protein HW555_011229 [Spodoptera exigua]